MDSIKALVSHLQAQGVDTKRAQLVGTVAHLPSGERRSYDGARMKVFTPAVIRLQILDPEASSPAVVAHYDAQTIERREPDSGLINTKQFLRCVRLEDEASFPHGSLAAVGKLMLEMVEHHRHIIGHSMAWERIEYANRDTSSITEQRVDLTLELERLTKYLELEGQWFSLLISSDEGSEAQFQRFAYEKLKLTNAFLRNPCSMDLYIELRKQQRASGHDIGMEFNHYYEWFRESEALFESPGQFNPKTREAMAAVIKTWYNTQSFGENFAEMAHKWACRNFKIHPMHREAVTRLIGDVCEELQSCAHQEQPRH